MSAFAQLMRFCDIGKRKCRADEWLDVTLFDQLGDLRHAVSAASGTAAASPCEVFAGFFAASGSLTSAYSAYAPPRPSARNAMTASPVLNLVMFAPALSTTPLISKPGIHGSLRPIRAPD